MRSPIIRILSLVVIWRILLAVVAHLSFILVPLGYTDRFLGGLLVNYQTWPDILAWANFDGEHYLSIALIGYLGLEQAFFPIYPLVVGFLVKPWHFIQPYDLVAAAVIGQMISVSSLVGALIGLWRLVRIDYPAKVADWTVVMMLIFPTSFFLAAVYSESIFLLLIVWSFYLARKGHWFWAGLLGMVASATRVFGVILLPALLLEAYQQRAKFGRSFWIFLIPLGLAAYMSYLWVTYGDPLLFYKLQKIVGEQHQSGVTLLPQVYYRYFKILLTTNFGNPIYQTVFLELVVALLFAFLCLWGVVKKMRWSYVAFAAIGFLVPSVQGSFSSVPRYVLVLFPCFISMSLIVSGFSKVTRLVVVAAMVVWLVGETAYFLRGFWVA